MSQKRNDGGQAFPSEGEAHGDPKYHSAGMSLRDWFAGQALAAMGAWCPRRETSMGISTQPLDGEVSRSERAKQAYLQADAMIAERDK